MHSTWTLSKAEAKTERNCWICREGTVETRRESQKSCGRQLALFSTQMSRR